MVWALLLSLFSLLGNTSVYALTSVQSTGQVKAELLAYAPEGIAPNQPMWLGLALTHEPEWHTYWKNPGDSGLPTELQWTLPAGVSVGDIIWPTPQQLPVGDLMNYGYADQALLVVPLYITPEFKPPFLSKALPIAVQANWLVCRTECIPQSVSLSLDVPLQSAIALHATAFNSVLESTPQTVSSLASAQVHEDILTLQTKALPAAWQGKTITVFPENTGIFAASAPIVQHWEERTGETERLWQAQIPLSPSRYDAPQTLSFLLHVTGNNTQPETLLLRSDVQGGWPDSTVAADIPPALQNALNAQASNANESAIRLASTSQANTDGSSDSLLLLSLLGALLGGLLLNLMPCVFPILAIKVLSFVQAQETPQQRRTQGLLYGLGVLLSFLLLGGLLVGLRHAGQALGWGFQLQSPWVVGALILLFLALGLNLLGVFEFRFSLPDSWANTRARNPKLDHFLSGVLAVLIATPCTAPFMGAALGAVIVLPWFQGLLIFGFLGVGLALPYVVFAFVPALGRLLPKPGAWMVTFRKVMAIPIFLTALWLAWVGAQLLQAPQASLNTVKVEALEHGVWHAWSAKLQQELQAQGKTVFVNYTAAWCITCQVNERGTLSRDIVLATFKQKGVILLKADWTHYNPEITAALRALDRLGVPVYTLQQGNGPVTMFSELLSTDALLSALDTLPNPAATSQP